MIGRYEVIAVQGQGGMATVFRALDTRLEREVAIKLIRTEMFPPAILKEVLARFEREAKALARLDHPNILRVFDFGEHDGVPYLVMAFVSGGSLRELLRGSGQSGRRMPYREAAALLAPVARALHYAHTRNIVHRDVKPANILLNDRGEPLLSDFGIAKILDAGGGGLTGTGLAIGTPEYMAPEQSAGDEVDARVDIYALGVVFFEMISGRRPFEGTTPIDVLVKIRTAPLPSIHQFLPDAPEAVELILSRSLARETAYRYANMALFAADLDALAYGASTPPAAQPAAPQAGPLTPPPATPPPVAQPVAAAERTTPQPFTPPRNIAPSSAAPGSPASAGTAPAESELDSGATLATPPSWPSAAPARPVETLPVADSGQTIQTPHPAFLGGAEPDRPATPPSFTPPPFTPPAPPPAAPASPAAHRPGARPSWLFILIALAGLGLVSGLVFFGGSLLPPAATPTYWPTETQAAALPSKTPSRPLPTPTQAIPPVTLEVWVKAYAGYEEPVKNLLNQYMKEHPHVTINMMARSSGELDNALKSDMAPDIALSYRDDSGRWAPYLLDLQDFGYAQEEVWNTFAAPAAASSVFQDRVWSLPADVEGIFLLYNRALVSQADFPADPTDMTAWIEAAYAYQQRSGLPLVCFALDPYNTAPILFSYGLPGYLDESGQVLLTSAEARNAFNALRTWIGLSIESPSWESCRQAFLDGQVAGWLTGPWERQGVKEAGIEYGIHPFGRPFVHGNAWMLTRSANEHGRTDEAMALLRYLTSAESQARISLASGNAPANLLAQADSRIQENADLAQLIQALAAGNALPAYRHTEAMWGPVHDAILDAWYTQEELLAILSRRQQDMESQVAAILENQQANLTIWVASELEYLVEALAELNQRLQLHNPNIQLEFVAVENPQNELAAATANGSGPDLVLSNANLLLQSPDLLAPMERYGLDGAFAWATYQPQAIETVNMEGQVWGLPLQMDGLAVVYNTALAGPQDFPADTLDMDGWLERASQYRKAHPDKVLLCIPPYSFFASPIFLGYGMPAFADVNGAVYLDTEEAYRAASFLSSWRAIAPPPADYAACEAAFLAGEAAAILNGNWIIGAAEQNQISPAILPFGRTFVSTRAFLLTSSAVDNGRARAAVEAALFLSGPEAQRLLASQAGSVPTHRAVTDSGEVRSNATLSGFLDACIQGVGLPPSRYADLAWGPVEWLVQELLSGESSAEEALAEAHRLIVETIEQPQP
jgi:serine/threonine protein kinase/maltose-binding protein MalE